MCFSVFVSLKLQLILFIHLTSRPHMFILTSKQHRMQDKNAEPDEELCVKVNLYMSDNSEAASAAGTTGSTTAADSSEGASGATAGGANGMDNAELLRMMQGALGSQEGGTMGTVPGNDIIPTAGAGQVRTLLLCRYELILS